MTTNNDTRTVYWGSMGCWEVKIPADLADAFHSGPFDEDAEHYGPILYTLNPELDDADIRRELIECGLEHAENFTAGLCFEYLSWMIACECHEGTLEVHND
jgi:hypothetical protein